MAYITIFIPVYNDIRYLPKALASAMAQQGVALKILVCDNASTDGTSEIIAKSAAEDPRIEHVLRPENIGMIANFNLGLVQIKTPYFMLLCSDDVLLSNDAMQKALTVMQAAPASASVYCDMAYIDGLGKTIAKRRFRRREVFDVKTTLRAALRTNRNQFGIPLLNRRATFDDIEYPREFPYAADVYVAVQSARHGSLHHIPEILIGNRFTGANATGELHRDVRPQLIAIAKAGGLEVTVLDRVLSLISFYAVSAAKAVFLRLASWRARRA